MASDNITAGLAGGLNSVNDLLGQFINYQYNRKAKQEDLMQQFNMYKMKQPYELQQDYNKKLQDTAIEYQGKGSFLPQEEASKIRIDQAKNHAKIPVLKSEALKMAANGTPLPLNSEIVDDTKPEKTDAEKNKGTLDKIQSQIDELNTTGKTLGVVKGLFNEGSSGKLAAMGRGTMGTFAATPVIGNALSPSAAQYESLKQELQPQLALALTGSKQGLVSLGKGAGKGIPQYGFDKDTGLQNFSELERQLNEKKLKLYQQKQNLGGDLSPDEMDDFSKVKSGGSDSFVQSLIAKHSK